MRSRRRHVFVPVAAVAASTVLLGCHRGDSILLIEVAGDLRLQPASFAVSVEPAQAAEKTFRVVPQGGSAGSTVTLPASLSIQMAPNLTGPVTVTVGAFDLNGVSIGYGSAVQTDINVGGETIVVVTLTPTSPFPVDAGTDALSGAGGSGVDASGVGGAGGSGAAGSGGAGGSGLGGRGGAPGGAGGVAGRGGLSGTGGKGGVSGAGGKGGSTGTGGMAGAGGTVGSGGAGGSAGGKAGASGSGGGTAGTSGAAGTTGNGGSSGGTAGAGGAAGGGPIDAGGDA